jgi:hypothetical protein
MVRSTPPNTNSRVQHFEELINENNRFNDNEKKLLREYFCRLQKIFEIYRCHSNNRGRRLPNNDVIIYWVCGIIGRNCKDPSYKDISPTIAGSKEYNAKMWQELQELMKKIDRLQEN